MPEPIAYLALHTPTFDLEDTSDDIETEKYYNLWCKETFTDFLEERVRADFDLNDEADDLEMLKVFQMWNMDELFYSWSQKKQYPLK